MKWRHFSDAGFFRMKRLTGFAFNKLLLHQLSWQEAFYKNDLICMNEYRTGKAFIKTKRKYSP